MSKAEVLDFCTRCMLAVQTKRRHAEELAAVLAEADYRGHFSHGFNRLEMYVGDVEGKMTSIENEPVILKETAATAYVDGKNCLGPVVGNFCMDLAIRKARSAGVGWVVAKGSNHYGIAGWYSLRASEKGLLGLSFTNTSPLVYPTRGKELTLGTNPITLAAPATSKQDEFVLDMATSTAALGKIEMCRRKKVPIPTGWAADKEGIVTNDAETAIKGGLLPLGGEESTGGYKGYGLSMMVEIFCGILGDACWGPNVRKWMDHGREANLGQCFIALDPDAFAPGFPERMTQFAHTMRSATPVDPSLPVLVPGDPERQHSSKCDREGIPYPPVLIDSMNALADRLHVPRLQTLK